jgi:two-component system cell cycle sensor histidine kinase/response regulator CckA
MSDQHKTPEQLEEELARLRQEAADLHAALAAGKGIRPVEGMPGDYDLLFETLSEALLVVRVRDGLILRANPCCRRLLGLAEGDLAGKTLYHFLPQAEAIIREAAAGSHLIPQRETVYCRPDGTNVAIEVGGAILGDAPDAAALLYLTDITKDVDARRLLRETEQRYRMVVESAADPIFMFDRAGLFTAVNPAAAKAMRRRPEDLVGKAMQDLFPPEIAERQGRQVRRVFETGEPLFSEENESRTAAGPRWFNTSLTPIRNDLGEVEYVIGIARDVTDRKRAESALRESRQELQAVQDTMVDGLLIADAETRRLVRANPAICRMLGYTQDELLTKMIGDIHPPDRVEDILRIFGAQVRGEHTMAGDVPCRRKDGSVFFAEISGSVITLDGRRYAIGVFRDVTQRKKAEEALRQSEENYRLLFESNMNGIAIIDPDGFVLRANSAYCDIHRFPPEKITGLAPWDLVAPHHREELHQKHEALFRGEITAYSGNFRIVRGDGTAGWVEVRASRMTWEGKPARLAIIQDISERVMLENELREVQKMEAIGQLAGGIAHDFNNLLTGILCSAQHLKAGPGIPKGVYETADVIEKASRRAAELTSQLLGFARRGKYQDVPVDLGATIQAVIQLMGGAIDPHITVEAVLPPEPVWTHGDPTQMEQVVLNLAMNARDAMVGDGNLTFAAETVELDAAACIGRRGAKPGRYVVLLVSDTGCGITEEIRGRIFEPFFTTKPKGKGTGMGLAMVDGTARNHGGWVEVDSTVGRGSTFRVYLPAHAGPLPERPAKKAGGIAGKKGRRPAGGAAAKCRDGESVGPCVMVVDDDEMVRKVLGLGYSVVAAANGREAVATYGMFGSSVDVVIIDMAMPDMDGRECFQALHRLDPNVKAILCTGGPADAETRDMVGRGMVDFLQKPYEAEQLAAAIAKALAARRAKSDGAL